MKKSFAILLLSIFMLNLFSNQAVHASKKWKTNKNPVAVFYIPHQDDELLTFGVGILNHIESGYNVHLVLYTDGQASNVFKQMQIEPGRFGEIRDKEFKRSAKSLGVHMNNLHFIDLPDGKVTTEDMREIILTYEKKFPGALHRGFSYYDLHNDHRVAGEALNELYNEGEIGKDTRLYINYGYYTTQGTEDPMSDRFRKKLLNASKAYKVNNPRFGFHAIGWKSAKPLFLNLEKNPKSMYHLPNYVEE
ncbi:PIG-L family deacetylase [Metabacillus indicus]|uniref:PIG-L family deacetylase n=1 Tax=Metabacillus indicus TaxID=246786 RepID=UPI0024939BD4|nr:PIG-L family deacetylase [Metabacillus indicus]